MHHKAVAVFQLCKQWVMLMAQQPCGLHTPVLAGFIACLICAVLQVVINDRVIRSFSLVNSGRVNYDFIWEVGSTSTLSVKPQAGSVPKGERRVVELSYAPTSHEKLEDHLVTCQVCVTMNVIDQSLMHPSSSPGLCGKS